MQIAPTSGAAETGVSEAKPKPSPGQAPPAAGADAASLLKTVQQALITDVATLSDLAMAKLLAPVPAPAMPGAVDPRGLPPPNNIQIPPVPGAGTINAPDSRLPPTAGQTLSNTGPSSTTANASAINFPDARLAPAINPATPINGVNGAGAVNIPDPRFAPLSQASAISGLGGAAPAKALELPLAGDGANVPAIAAADLPKLAQILQPVNPPERVLRVDNLIRETITAIRDGRMEFAVGRLIEAATADPTRVDELRSLPELAPIRANVEHVVGHLANVAKMDAETKMTAAEQLFESAGSQKLLHWETAPGELLRVGHRLIEAGGYVNYVRSGELATTLQSAYWGAMAVDPLLAAQTPGNVKKLEEGRRRKGAGSATIALLDHKWDALRQKGPQRLRATWQRAPLLVLFGAWLALGLVAGVASKLAAIISPESWIVGASDIGFEIWGLGFLALVGLGFWASVRKRRS